MTDTPTACSRADCPSPRTARGLCKRHYGAVRARALEHLSARHEDEYGALLVMYAQTDETSSGFLPRLWVQEKFAAWSTRK